jgi:hypothetical protein
MEHPLRKNRLRNWPKLTEKINTRVEVREVSQEKDFQGGKYAYLRV